MKRIKKDKKFLKNRGFSFIELALVLAVIGALIGGIIGGQKAVELAALNGARSATITSPVSVIDGLVLWLDTTSKKSFDETETKNSTKITNWYDINPKKNDSINFTQTTTADKPTYTVKAIGRLPALVFSSNVMHSVNTVNIDRLLSPTGEVTVFAVGKNSLTGGLNASFFWYWNGGTDRVGFAFANASPSIYWNSGVCCAGVVNTSFSSYTGQWVILSGIRKSDTTELRINGIQKSIATTPIVGISHSTAVQAIVGTGDNAGSKLGGGMAEVIVFNRGLGSSEVASIEAYLSQKWKIKLQ